MPNDRDRIGRSTQVREEGTCRSLSFLGCSIARGRQARSRQLPADPRGCPLTLTILVRPVAPWRGDARSAQWGRSWAVSENLTGSHWPDRMAASGAAKQAAKVTLDLARKQMQSGHISYLALLSVEQTYQQALLILVQAQANRYAIPRRCFRLSAADGGIGDMAAMDRRRIG